MDILRVHVPLVLHVCPGSTRSRVGPTTTQGAAGSLGGVHLHHRQLASSQLPGSCTLPEVDQTLGQRAGLPPKDGQSLGVNKVGINNNRLLSGSEPRRE